MDYSKYKQSRDLTWQILINHNVSVLPVKVSQICRVMNIRIFSYSKGYKYIANFNDYALNNDGFTFDNCIFYNDQCNAGRQRFTVAHELGHCLLHGGKGLYNREPTSTDQPIEQEANVFASRLLAPACVLWGLNVKNAKQISDLCNISMQSAEFRMERMSELYRREQDFLQRYGKSCFLMSDLEKQVYKQFKPFIESYKL